VHGGTKKSTRSPSEFRLPLPFPFPFPFPFTFKQTIPFPLHTSSTHSNMRADSIGALIVLACAWLVLISCNGVSAQRQTRSALAFARSSSLAGAHSHPLALNDHHCEGCKDGEPTDTCPHPSLCGYKPILCVDCMEGMAMPKCPNASWCVGVDCSSSANCIDSQPTPSCPDPGVCGFEPLLCTGCVPGLWRYACPHPEWCLNNQTTPPCVNCMDGMAMPLCPNATACTGMGPKPDDPHPDPPGIQCIDCMEGMSMPQCPDPDLCVIDCPMTMYFGASKNFCFFLQNWQVKAGWQWLMATIGVLILAAMREGMSVFRMHKVMVRKQENALRRMWSKDPSAAPAGWYTANEQRSSGSSSRYGSGLVNRAANSSPTGRSTPFLSDVGGASAPPAPSSSPPVDPVVQAGVRLTTDEMESRLVTSTPTDGVDQDPDEAVPFIPPPENPFIMQCFDSFYYVLSLCLGYLLMLLIMTYNIAVCLIVVLSCFIMHLLFNLVWSTRWKARYMANVRSLVRQFQARQREKCAAMCRGAAGPGASSSVAVASSQAAAVEAAVDTNFVPAPTAGDHCCPEDVDFDD